jgi:hypothetical protein
LLLHGQAAAAETIGWRETYEKDASAVLYNLQHMVAENGELEELHKKGGPRVFQAPYHCAFKLQVVWLCLRLGRPFKLVVDCTSMAYA